MLAFPPRWAAARCLLVPVLLVPTLVACDRSSAEDLPVWTPNDHDNRSNPGADQTDTTAPRPAMPSLSEHGIDDVVLATWKQNCTTCHGLIGRGDGPQAAMFRPPDLTSAAFQDRAIEAMPKPASRFAISSTDAGVCTLKTSCSWRQPRPCYKHR